MPLGHFLGGMGVDRKAPTRNPRSPVEHATKPMSLKREEVNGLPSIIRQYRTMTSAVQIAATAAPSSKPRLRFTFMLPPHNECGDRQIALLTAAPLGWPLLWAPAAAG